MYDDYIDYYQNLESKLEKNERFEDIIEFINQRRVKQASSREELRGIKIYDDSNDEVESDFDKTVLNLVRGSQLVNHDFEHFAHKVRFYGEEYKAQRPKTRHTISPPNYLLDKVIAEIRFQRDYLTKCFQDVTRAYNIERDMHSGRHKVR
ncbi:hypothetical protein GURASL_31150 [Geotalea uraniireducens]|uniref:Uncharacterized protein n=1 Tax=Geotalea uraniireducens TaxID=351604 RepID=A0ABN6VWR7_9BACT|nr:hypothetical protein [Geotalea uraniireducens]BDV44192.1 hypothetical protein GURASL_31150 [Geotalea uraniireducens]